MTYRDPGERLLEIVDRDINVAMSLPGPGFDPRTAARHVLTAHLIELRQAEVIDDDAFRVIAGPLSEIAVQAEESVRVDSTYLSSLEELIDGGLPATVRGVATLGLAREEWGATIERLAWRHCSLVLGAAQSRLMKQFLEFAHVHAVTVMPAYAGGRLVQPTTLAHYLGGTIEPLREQRTRHCEGFARLNRCPMGAGILVGSALDPDRTDLASRLGFDGPIPTTFDAVSGTEDVLELVDLTASTTAVLVRFLNEIQLWHRTDPTSFLVDERWLSRPEPSLPAFETPSRLDMLVADLGQVGGMLDTLRHELRQVSYGPIANRRFLRVDAAMQMESRFSSVTGDVASFLAEGLIVNRAYLGNRAGRGMVTGGDLAFFLISEEQIAPTAALEITSLVLARLRDANLEVSGITQDMIDAAALLTIGREIKVEMETLGRYLAPRRYLERRQVTGSAAPAMTREWLETVVIAQRRDDEWLASSSQAIDSSLASLDQVLIEASNETPDD